MPFPKQVSREFTKAGVEALVPGYNGCYGLFRQGVWVYAGKGDIRERLLCHLGGDNPCITKQAPTHYVTAVTQDMDQMEKNLILELDPVCNKKIG